MNAFEEFAKKYVEETESGKKGTESKKYSKKDIKQICEAFVEHLAHTIEQTAKTNKTIKTKDVRVFGLNKIGNFSLSFRTKRKINLPGKSVEIPSHLVLKFRPGTVIKEVLKKIAV